MKVLLTGATGFLGSEIARQLVAAGHDLRILARKRSLLDGVAGLPLEKFEGDILDRASVLRALDGCDALIHAAANVSARRRDRDILYRVNVEGTRTVLGAALEKGVKRVVYTSSIATIGATRRPELQDENAVWDLEPIGYHYVTAKRRAEEVALDLFRRGLPVVILNPGVILGPGDVYLSSTKLLREYALGHLRFYIGGGTSACDVRDVARAHVAALTRGRAGERYILSGQNYTLGEILETAARISGLGAPVRIPYAAAWLLALALEAASLVAEHRFEDLNRPMVRLGGRFAFHDVSKAARELGYTVTPVDDTIRDTLADHVRRGLIRSSTPELLALKAGAPAPAVPAAVAAVAA